MARCKSCEQEIIFVLTDKGRRMPLDAERTPEGTWEPDDTGRARRVDDNGHLPHHMTCPEGKAWKGRTREQGPA